MADDRRCTALAIALGALAAVALFALAWVVAERRGDGGAGEPAAAARTAVLLAINDTYRIEGLAGGREGGLAR